MRSLEFGGVLDTVLAPDAISPLFGEIHDASGSCRSFAETMGQRGYSAVPRLPLRRIIDSGAELLAALDPPRSFTDFESVHPGNARVRATPRSLEKMRDIYGNGLPSTHPAHEPGLYREHAQLRAVQSVLFGWPHATFVTSSVDPRSPGPRAQYAHSGLRPDGVNSALPLCVVQLDDKAAFDVETGTRRSSYSVAAHETTHVVDHVLAAYDARLGISPFETDDTYHTTTERNAITSELAMSYVLGDDGHRESYGELVCYDARHPARTSADAPLVEEALRNARARLVANGMLTRGERDMLHILAGDYR